MTWVDKIVTPFIGVYIVIALLYAINKQWMKALYYMSAALINVAVVGMKG